MGMTAVEKVLALKSGSASVRAGDVVYPDPDYVMIHDGAVLRARRDLESVGLDALAAPDKVVMVSDHDVLYGSAAAAERGAVNRQTARLWGVRNFFDAGRGGHGHIFPMECGMLLPGMLYFDNDRHCTNAGAIGAFAFSIAAEITRVLATGTTWVKVPHSVRLTIHGQLKPGVYARDLGFHLVNLIDQGRLPVEIDYRVIEFDGDIVQFNLAERVALCSSLTEMCAGGIFFPPSPDILAHAQSHAQRRFAPVLADADARYESGVKLDVGSLEPQIVPPGGLPACVDVSAVAGIEVNHAFIGSCGSGMYYDLQVAAAVLKGRRVAPGVRLFVAPGSQASTRRMLDDGIMRTLMDAGAILLPAGCGPCNDAVVGPVHAGEVSISTATNSNTGRFGSKDARLYLGSPATVAASAVAGRIRDAREIADLSGIAGGTS